MLASTTAAALQTSLSSKLATAATASTALGVTVEEVPTVATASPAASGDLPEEEGEAGLPLAAIGGIVGGGALLLLAAAGAGAVWCRRQRRLTIHEELSDKEGGRPRLTRRGGVQNSLSFAPGV